MELKPRTRVLIATGSNAAEMGRLLYSNFVFKALKAKLSTISANTPPKIK